MWAARAANAAKNATAAALSALLCTACGGGIPLMHPARTLPRGEVRGAAGVSAQAPVGTLASDLQNARNDAAATGSAQPLPGDVQYAKGALIAAAVAPGLAPYVSARVGVGWTSEGGIAYTGRAARIDMRKSFDLSESSSVSIGAGLTVPFYGRQGEEALPNVDLSALHGYGFDVPLLIGWESSGGIYKLWGGVRGGYEYDAISNVSTEPKAVPLGFQPISLSANRVYGAGVVGMAVGFRHLHVALELDASYQSISGTFNATDVKVAGVSLAPASAIWWQF
ncbi:MAG: hypothetical protein ABI461_09770 [Polyangiaceae bacterium]